MGFESKLSYLSIASSHLPGMGKVANRGRQKKEKEKEKEKEENEQKMRGELIFKNERKVRVQMMRKKRREKTQTQRKQCKIAENEGSKKMKRQMNR